MSWRETTKKNETTERKRVTAIEKWLEQEEKVKAEQKKLWELREEAEKQPLPENLRKATPEDVFVGNILWYKDGDEGPFWQRVDDVYNSSSQFKAYCGHSGCRYGIERAFVEDKQG